MRRLGVILLVVLAVALCAPVWGELPPGATATTTVEPQVVTPDARQYTITTTVELEAPSEIVNEAWLTIMGIEVHRVSVTVMKQPKPLPAVAVGMVVPAGAEFVSATVTLPSGDEQSVTPDVGGNISAPVGDILAGQMAMLAVTLLAR